MVMFAYFRSSVLYRLEIEDLHYIKSVSNGVSSPSFARTRLAKSSIFKQYLMVFNATPKNAEVALLGLGLKPSG